MKKFTIFIAIILFSYIGFSQTIVLTDNDGASLSVTNGQNIALGNYTPGSVYTLTVCSADPNNLSVGLNIMTYSFPEGASLKVYDGVSASGPLNTVFNSSTVGGTVGTSASVTNTTGCFTFVFTSSVTGAAFTGYLSLHFLCMPRSVNISSNPNFIEEDGNNYLNLCWDYEEKTTQTVNFTAHGTYPEGVGYTLDDASVKFTWHFGDGDVGLEGIGLTNVSHEFLAQKGFAVTVETEDSKGCVNNNITSIRVRVARAPKWNKLTSKVDPLTICMGELASACCFYEDNAWNSSIIPTVAETVHLPDGIGVCYESPIVQTQFSAGSKVVSSEDIQEICTIIRHTFVGDLKIYIICPNGSTVQLHNQGGGGTDLGTSSEGYKYCWSTSASQTMAQAASSAGSTLPPGTFLPVDGNFDGLIGCPLNGKWVFRICDHWAQDSGVNYGWYLEFDDDVYPPPWEYSLNYDNLGWSGEYGAVINPPVEENCATVTYATTSTPNNNSVQNFYFQVKDEYNCLHDTTLSLTVKQVTHPDCLPVIIPDFTLSQVLCHDGTSTVTFTGSAIDGSVFNWDFGDATVVSGSGQGPYLLSFPNSGSNTVSLIIEFDVGYGNVLSESSQQTITIPEEIVSSISTQDCLCFESKNGKAIITANGGTAPLSYNWGDASVSTSETANDLSEGSYTITITDVNGCIHTNSFQINQPELLVANASIVSPILCYGETASLTVSAIGGSLPYAGIGDFSEVPAGEYTYTVTDVNDCTADVSISVPQPDPLLLKLEIKDPIKCFGGEAILELSAEGGVLPYTGVGEFIVLAGEYSYQVTDANACLASISNFVVEQPDLLVAKVETTEEIKCYGEQALLTVSATGGTTPYTTVGTYSVPIGIHSYEVTDANACKDDASVEVTQPDKLVLTGSSVNNPCSGYEQGKINIKLVGGIKPYIYSWTPAIAVGDVLTNLPNGEYSVLVTDQNGCKVDASYIITSPDRLWMDCKTTDILCYGDAKGEVQITAGGGVMPYLYKISTTQASKLANSFYNLYAGKYIIRLIDANNCSLSSNIEIFQNPEIVANYELTNPSCIGSSDGRIDFTILGGIPPYLLKWDDNTNESGVLTDLSAGKFNFYIEDDINCVVNLKPEVVLQDNPVDCLIVPNAFTPNGDGINDVWIIENIEMFPTAVVRVFNRWGQELWSGGCNDRWDGTYKGNKVPCSTYTYTIMLYNGIDDRSGMVSVVY